MRRSSLAFCKLITAHRAAGTHPNSVHCNSRHSRPVSILPLSKKDNHGRRIASKVIMVG